MKIGEHIHEPRTRQKQYGCYGDVIFDKTKVMI